jgi:argininosuccinate lyase
VRKKAEAGNVPLGKSRKAWAGRFQEETDPLVEAFTTSLPVDRRLYRCDIRGSIAHARMLARRRIISRQAAAAIEKGLLAIRDEIDRGVFAFRPEDEDIHMAVERALTERIGPAGGKLHTGRSRNDQVALDVRLYLRDEIDGVLKGLQVFKRVLVSIAKKEIGTMIPGYTHLQRAQPVLLSHYFLAFWEMLDRDESRFRDCRKRLNVMPLGSAALAGTSLPLDRAYAARLLKFPEISANSMDAVSDRDFLLEFLFAAALAGMHWSRLCEDLILWSTQEFGFVEIPDAFATGSSLMPQKKNPDVAELVRGKTGRFYGNLMAMLTVMKGLPLTYNRDLQEDKESLFDSVDTVKACLAILPRMLKSLKFDRARMRRAAGGFSTATEVADYLVKKGVPFREAHGIVGRLVGSCLRNGKTFEDLTLPELKEFSPAFDREALGCFDVARAVNRKTLYGGTAEDAVRRRIREIEGT